MPVYRFHVGLAVWQWLLENLSLRGGGHQANMLTNGPSPRHLNFLFAPRPLASGNITPNTFFLAFGHPCAWEADQDRAYDADGGGSGQSGAAEPPRPGGCSALGAQYHA